MLSSLLLRRHLSYACVTLLALLISGITVRPAHAQIGSDRYASIVVEVQTGNILSAANMDTRLFPASLTKMMTLYMLFEALRDRRAFLNEYVPVSAEAASMPPTKLGLVPGSRITVEQAILGLVTKSANDAAAALGEMLGGDEDRFAQMMTVRARALGMTSTQFRNASGLPDETQFTTARDMAILARHLIQDFPNYYHYFSTPGFVFNGRYVPSHQHMLENYPGADGLKTGYIHDSGYNVVTSAVHGNTRLIGVVFGASTGWERDQHMASLLDAGFDRLGVTSYIARQDTGRFPAFVSTARAASSPSPYIAAQVPVPAYDPAPTPQAPTGPVFASRSMPRDVHASSVRAGLRRGRDPRAERGLVIPPVFAARSAATYERQAARVQPARVQQAGAQVTRFQPVQHAQSGRVRQAAQVQAVRPQSLAPRRVSTAYTRKYGG